MSILPRTRRKAVIAFIIVTAMLDIVGLGIIIPVFPSLVVQFTGSNAQAGWINGVFVATDGSLSTKCPSKYTPAKKQT
jgi:DHA1 family tetracycline resistance protein-like MFS transporter